MVDRERTVALTVERLSDGEVSPYLAEALGPGDGLEERGPTDEQVAGAPGVGRRA